MQWSWIQFCLPLEPSVLKDSATSYCPHCMQLPSAFPAILLNNLILFFFFLILFLCGTILCKSAPPQKNHKGIRRKHWSIFIWMFSHSVLDNEYFFVDPDLKLTKVAPEGWKEEPKKKSKAAVNFTLFFRIKFFMDDISLIQWVHKFLFLSFWLLVFGPFSLLILSYLNMINENVFSIIKEIFPST